MTEEGHKKLDWAAAHMPVLQSLKPILIESGAMKDKKISMALHVEAKTGVLALTLQEAGAKVSITSCNPLSTDDDVANALREKGMDCRAACNQCNEDYYAALNGVLDHGPDFIIDDGCDLIKLLHTTRTDLMGNVIGGNEETTTGIVRLKSMEREKVLKFPVFNVNDAYMKHLFDNRYGTGQSTFDGIMTATNLVVAGKVFVVAGYGWCGRGIAMRAKGMGANVVVTEIDPVKAIEATMDGFRVMQMDDAVEIADFIVTATGNCDVVAQHHYPMMKDGCVLANSGHFDNEIDKNALSSMAQSEFDARYNVKGYKMLDGRTIYLLADGRLVNLASGQGHPAEIMDLSFSIQALCADYLLNNPDMMPGVHGVPDEIDLFVAKRKLELSGVKIDKLTPKQEEYMSGWKEGT